MAKGFASTDAGGLAAVRRLEAAGFRAWPASFVHYDGTWAVRLNAGHPAKRLNSVNPLDPADTARVAERIARAGRRFAAYGRPVTFRLSPLAGPLLQASLDAKGWSIFAESLVMRLDLERIDFDRVLNRIPLQDVGLFMEAALRVQSLDPALRPGLSEIISSIEPETGLFVGTEDGAALTTAICVRDGDLAGLFEIATLPSARGRGHGRRAVLSALKWARGRGAVQAWLQVEAENEAALALYRSIGFTDVYRYHYRREPDA